MATVEVALTHSLSTTRKWQFEIAPSIALVRSFLTEFSPVNAVWRFKEIKISVNLHCRDQRKVFNFLLLSRCISLKDPLDIFMWIRLQSESSLSQCGWQLYQGEPVDCLEEDPSAPPEMKVLGLFLWRAVISTWIEGEGVGEGGGCTVRFAEGRIIGARVESWGNHFSLFVVCKIPPGTLFRRQGWWSWS